MQAVVDTDVWVSAFLTPGGTAARLLEAMYSGRLVPVFSPDIELEYGAVLARPKFNIDPAVLGEFFNGLGRLGRFELDVPPLDVELPHAADAPFVALASHVGCSVVTGNARHFPKSVGVLVLTPAEWVAGQAGI